MFHNPHKQELGAKRKKSDTHTGMEIYEREIENTDKNAKVEGESSIQQDIVHVTNVEGT